MTDRALQEGRVMRAKRMIDIMDKVTASLTTAVAELEPIGAEKIGPDGMALDAIEALGKALGFALVCQEVLKTVLTGCMEEFADLDAADAALQRGLNRVKAGRVPAVGQA